MKLTTINKKFVLLEFPNNEHLLNKLSKETKDWIADMIDRGFTWGGFFVKVPPVDFDKHPELSYEEAVKGKRWGGSWELKAKWNKKKWESKFKRKQNA